MQKVEVCRASGLPVTTANLDKYREDMRSLYDKVVRKAGYDPNKPMIMDADDAKRCQKLLDRLERILLKKYPNTETWEQATNSEDWLKLVEEYGPIMLAKSEEGRLVYVIYDVQI